MKADEVLFFGFSYCTCSESLGKLSLAAMAPKLLTCYAYVMHWELECGSIFVQIPKTCGWLVGVSRPWWCREVAATQPVRSISCTGRECRWVLSLFFWLCHREMLHMDWTCPDRLAYFLPGEGKAEVEEEGEGFSGLCAKLEIFYVVLV